MPTTCSRQAPGARGRVRERQPASRRARLARWPRSAARSRGRDRAPWVDTSGAGSRRGALRARRARQDQPRGGGGAPRRDPAGPRRVRRGRACAARARRVGDRADARRGRRARRVARGLLARRGAAASRARARSRAAIRSSPVSSRRSSPGAACRRRCAGASPPARPTRWRTAARDSRARSSTPSSPGIRSRRSPIRFLDRRTQEPEFGNFLARARHAIPRASSSEPAVSSIRVRERARGSGVALASLCGSPKCEANPRERSQELMTRFLRSTVPSRSRLRQRRASVRSSRTDRSSARSPARSGTSRAARCPASRSRSAASRRASCGPRRRTPPANFIVPLLPPGRYTTKATISGFETFVSDGDVIQAERTTDVTISLKLASTRESVEVVGTTPLIDRTNTTDTTTVRAELTDKLPVVRGYQNVLTMAPGTDDIDGDGNPNSRGAPDSGNLFLFDGVDTTDPTTGTFGANNNFDTIQEVVVSNTGVSAEYGRVQGGVFNVITKSGHEHLPRLGPRAGDERQLERRQQGHQPALRECVQPQQVRREHLRLPVHAGRAGLEGPRLVLRRLRAQSADDSRAADADLLPASRGHGHQLHAQPSLRGLAGQDLGPDHAVSRADVLRAGGSVHRRRPRLLGRRGGPPVADRPEPVRQLPVGVHLAGCATPASSAPTSRSRAPTRSSAAGSR